MICTNCGAPNPDDKKFCSNCGTPMRPVGTTATPDAGTQTSNPAYGYGQPSQAQPPMQQAGAPNMAGAQYQQPQYQQQYQQQQYQQPYGAQPSPYNQQPYGAPNPQPPKKGLPIIPIVIIGVAVLAVIGIVIAFALAPSSSGSSSSSASASASSSSDPSAAFVGTYKATGATGGAKAGDQVIYLAEDGTAAMTYSGNAAVGSWKSSDGKSGSLTLNANGQDISYDIELDGDTLSVLYEKQSIVFERTSSDVTGMPTEGTTSTGGSSGASSQSSASSNSAFVGTWKLTAMSGNGQNYTQQQIEASGASITITMKADGSFTYGAQGATMSGTWKETSSNQATLTMQGSPLTFTLKDSKTLTTVDQGVTMTFTKQ